MVQRVFHASPRIREKGCADRQSAGRDIPGRIHRSVLPFLVFCPIEAWIE